jgi:outer membrane lipoprotein SlyB
MKHLKPVLVTTAVATALLAGCAGDPYYSSQPQPYPSASYPAQSYPPQSYPPYAQPQGYNLGVVDRIEVIRKGDTNNVAGTVIGGIVGGLIGHQIGSGRGNTAATIAGAAGGAVAGNQIQQRSRGPNEAFRVTVRMDDGSYRTVTQENITDLRTGDRVRLDGDYIQRV